jgi:quinol monooxygenase YgiN
MLIVHVHVSVKPEAVEAFRLASLENSRKSLQEPGIARFDVLQEEGGSNSLRASRNLSHTGSARGAQGNRALREMA